MPGARLGGHWTPPHLGVTPSDKDLDSARPSDPVIGLGRHARAAVRQVLVDLEIVRVEGPPTRRERGACDFVVLDNSFVVHLVNVIVHASASAWHDNDPEGSRIVDRVTIRDSREIGRIPAYMY